MADHRLKAGLHGALLTAGLSEALRGLPTDDLVAVYGELLYGELLNAESADRVSRHVAKLLARAIDAAPADQRAATAPASLT